MGTCMQVFPHLSDLISLGSEHLRIDVDPGRGADILALTHRASGIDVFLLAVATACRRRPARPAQTDGGRAGSIRCLRLAAYRAVRIRRITLSTKEQHDG